jgi:hypothetical protein
MNERRTYFQFSYEFTSPAWALLQATVCDNCCLAGWGWGLWLGAVAGVAAEVHVAVAAVHACDDRRSDSISEW